MAFASEAMMAGILTRFLERFRPLKRDDKLFGSMTYMGDRLRYWEGKAAFPPQEVKIEVFVSAGKDDSMEAQYEFYHGLCRAWAELDSAIGAKLKEVFEQANHKSLEKDVWKEFEVRSVSVPLGPLDTSLGL